MLDHEPPCVEPHYDVASLHPMDDSELVLVGLRGMTTAMDDVHRQTTDKESDDD